MLRTAFAAAAFSLALALPAAAQNPTTTDAASATQGTYKIDPAHTSVLWKVNHLGFSMYTARFDKAAGELYFDPQQPERSTLNVSVDPASISTGLPNFDEKLQGEKYFDTANHPQITFKTTGITRTGETTGTMTGDLTLRGVTKPVTFDVTFIGGGTHPMKDVYTLGFSATAKIKRSDFGMTELINFNIGDEVEIVVQTEFNHDA